MSAFDDTEGQKETRQEKEAKRLLAIATGDGDPATAEAYAAAADEAERRRAAEMAALGTPALEHVREATDIDPETRGAWNFRPGIDPVVQPPGVTAQDVARNTAGRALGLSVGYYQPQPSSPAPLTDKAWPPTRQGTAAGAASVPGGQAQTPPAPPGQAPATLVSPSQVTGSSTPASQTEQAQGGTAAQGLLSLPPSYYASAMLIGQQAASQPDVADTGQSPYAGGLIDYLKTLDNRLTEAERKKNARRERAGRIITALGDGISAISDIVATNRYAPYVKREPLSPRYAAMWDRYYDDLDADDGRWRDLYINAWLKDRADAAARGAAEAERQQNIIDNSLKLGDLELKAAKQADDAAAKKKANEILEKRLALDEKIAEDEKKRGWARLAKDNGSGKGSGGSDDKPKEANNRGVILGDGRQLIFNINDDIEAITYVSFLADAGILVSNPFDALGNAAEDKSGIPPIAAMVASGSLSPKDLARYGDYARALIASVKGRQGKSDKERDEELVRRYEAATGRKATVKDLRTDASAWEDE